MNLNLIGSYSEEDSYYLNELKKYIEDELQVNVNSLHVKDEGGKSIGLTTTLEIAGLVISSIGTFVTVLQYWQSSRKQYKVIYKSNNIEVELNNLSHEEVINIIKSDSLTSNQAIIDLIKS